MEAFISFIRLNPQYIPDTVGVQTAYVRCKVRLDSPWVYREKLVAIQRLQYHLYVTAVV